mmetsp:Transcript_7090/g.17035  ORF Transcript_7090/g.17035 Transcript_7090/m.17035 type:complete len:88 (-) Transcript_7090:191-454(-)
MRGTPQSDIRPHPAPELLPTPVIPLRTGSCPVFSGLSMTPRLLTPSTADAAAAAAAVPAAEQAAWPLFAVLLDQKGQQHEQQQECCQ